MKATKIIMADGRTSAVELGTNRCWDSEEVAEVQITVPRGTLCGICGNPLEIKTGESKDIQRPF